MFERFNFKPKQFKKITFSKIKNVPRGRFLVDKIIFFCYDDPVMTIPQKVINFLNKSEIKYEVIKHRPVYTALDKARTLKIKEKLVGKTVILKVNKNIFIVLIPADAIVNLEKIEKILNFKKIGFANEKWLKENLKGMKEGAIPPFGPIWNLPVLIDKLLLKNSKIIVNSGERTLSIQLTSSSLRRLIPDLREGFFSKKKIIKKKKKKSGA